MKTWKTAEIGPRWVARLAATIALTALCQTWSLNAQADTLVKAATVMVYGSASDTYSIEAPSAGTITAQVTSVPWPTPLAALSFNLTSATEVLSSVEDSTRQALALSDSQPQIETYQVGAGTYFAHVMATAGGSLDLGLYSVLLTFAPSAVPLPTAAGLLLIGLLALFGLRSTTLASRNESVISVA
jgi:hypothetical protein